MQNNKKTGHYLSGNCRGAFDTIGGMKRSIMLLSAAFLLNSACLYAHLCNDVFAQADDNLAVKVDIRDGQLRVGQTASFKVYLLNTMDRAIATIGLEVLSAEFDAKVEPASDWKRFPYLETTKNGGQKQYFTVTLNRKAGIPDGKYKIDLRLFNPNNKSMEFKTVSLSDAGGTKQLKPARNINVDGNPLQEEWAQSILCSDFYSYEKSGGYFCNKRVDSQPRVRFSADKENLYCLVTVADDSAPDQDVFSIYASPTMDDSPRVLKIDRINGQVVSSEQGTAGITVKKSTDGKQVECRIPRNALNISGSNSFYLNLTRTVVKSGKEQTLFWRANPMSILNPVIYEKFMVE